MNVQFFYNKALYQKFSETEIMKILSILIICLPVKFTIRLIRSFKYRNRK